MSALDAGRGEINAAIYDELGMQVYGPSVTALSDAAELARKYSPVLAGSAAIAIAAEASGRFDIGSNLATADIRIYAKLAALKGAAAKSPSRSICARPTPSRRPASCCRGQTSQRTVRKDRGRTRRLRRCAYLPDSRACATMRWSRFRSADSQAISALHRRISSGPGPTASSRACSSRTRCSATSPVKPAMARRRRSASCWPGWLPGEGEILTVAVARAHRRQGLRLAADGRRAARAACRSAPKRCSSKSTRPTSRPSRSTGGSAFPRSASARATTSPPTGSRGALVMRRDLR